MVVGTHDGSFHADEVFAVAALSLRFGQVEVRRTRAPEALRACDVRVDVGLRFAPETGDFDHHQRGGAKTRPTGVPYASFGLVWRAFGAEICRGDEEAASRVDDLLGEAIDAHDTGCARPAAPTYSVSQVISRLNAAWDEDLVVDRSDERFAEAVRLAKSVLQREIADAAATVRANGAVREAVRAAQDPRLIELACGMPWQNVVVREAPSALLVTYPAADGSVHVRAVPSAVGSFDTRCRLPAAWAGLSGSDLVAASGVAGAVFCHAARYLAVASDREAALALAAATLTDGAPT